MLRSSIVIMLVLLSYVSVLNFVVVSFLYRQYSSPATQTARAVHASPVRRAADSVHRMLAPDRAPDVAPDVASARAPDAHADAADVQGAHVRFMNRCKFKSILDS